MSIRIGNFTVIHRDRGTETGLSALDGDPIETIADLPEHLVEVHVFRDGQYASTFVEGVLCAGLGNAVGLTHQTGATHVNAVVLIARFDEPRLDGATPIECLRVVRHEPNFAPDLAAREADTARHLAESNARYEREKAFAKADAAPIAHHFKENGFEAKIGRYAGTSGVTVTRHRSTGSGRSYSVDHSTHFSISIEHGGRVETVRTSGYDLAQGELDLRGRYREIAGALGLAFDKDNDGLSDFVVLDPPQDAAGLLDAVLALETCLKECAAAKSAAYLARFRAGMKVTAARRRLFKAGMDHGLAVFNQRANTKARAGGETIGQTEINALVRMGWIRPGGPGFIVTDEALDAAGIERVANEDVERVPFVHGPR